MKKKCVSGALLLVILAVGGATQAADTVDRMNRITQYTREPVVSGLAEKPGEAARWNSPLRYPDWWLDGPEGLPFATYLTQGYRRYAKHEDHVNDFEEAAKFGQRADEAERGAARLPEELYKRTLPSYAVPDLTTARARLMFALGRGSSAVLPKLSATAQVMFDCWMEQQEENIQPHDVAACRDSYKDAMCRIEHAMQIPGICWSPSVPAVPKPAPVALPPAPAAMPACKAESFMAYFDLDKDSLTPVARETIKTVVKVTREQVAGRVVLSAHTDRSASQAYNEDLSKRRESAVARGLIEAGLPRNRIDGAYYGEDRPRVMTPDGVRNGENRRVEINLRCK